MPAPLTLRALNRATLARQMLLAREKTTPLRVIERLVGLQAQIPKPPYLGIWSRMAGFGREDLTRLVLGRKAVRATAMRGTLHLMTAKDYLSLRATLQPALTHGALAVLRSRMKSIEVERLVEVARGFFAAQPRTFEELRDFLSERYPRGDIRAMAYMVRTHLPLVQVPTETTWGYATISAFALADSWLRAKPEQNMSPERLVTRYLAAFGPATPADLKVWSGLPAPAARETFDALRPKLTVLRGERRKELFDLPQAPRPPEDAEAPVRFLPEFDNLVLSHDDRRRFVADAHRRSVYLPGLRVAATFLVDGFVAGTWKVERVKGTAFLTVQPLGKLEKNVREALAEEGKELARFVEGDASRHEVRFATR